MNGQLLEDHYVYGLYDSENILRYVGHGRGNRYKDKSKRDRSSEFLEILKTGSIKILHSDLSKSDAIEIENSYINKYLNNKTTQVNLINKATSREYKILKYEDVSMFLELSKESPTQLIWKIDKAPILKGQFAGSVSGEYASVMLNYKHLLVHRIVWVLYNKQDLFPEFVINNIDGNKLNNSPNNLEKVSTWENNRKITNTILSNTGVRGVFIISNGKKVKSTISHGGIVFEKTFSIKKYRLDIAISMASKWHSDKVLELGLSEYFK